MNKLYRLDIYEYYPLTGTPCNCTSVDFDDPKRAKQYAESIPKKSFAYAVLLKLGTPCDWNGEEIDFDKKREWPKIYGDNKGHPAYEAFASEVLMIVGEIVEIYEKTKEPMVEIAARVMKERHPDVSGWSERLAWKSSELITTKRAAEIIGVQPVTVKRWCQQNKIKGAIKPGHDWLVPEKAAHELKRK